MIRQTANGNSIGVSTSRSWQREVCVCPSPRSRQPDVNSDDSQQTIYNLQPARSVFYEMCFINKEARGPTQLICVFFRPEPGQNLWVRSGLSDQPDPLRTLLGDCRFTVQYQCLTRWVESQKSTFLNSWTQGTSCYPGSEPKSKLIRFSWIWFDFSSWASAFFLSYHLRTMSCRCRCTAATNSRLINH